MNPPLQFGECDPDKTYEDRRAVFGVAVRAGQVALARISRGADHYFDLPGGALDAGETEEAALVREYLEETGLSVQVDDLMVRANQYKIKADGAAVNNRSAFYSVAVVRHEPELKAEADHELVWTEPVEALARLRHGAHAFALAAWLKLQREAANYAEGPSVSVGPPRARTRRAAAARHGP